ncbi:MAG TPA: nucleotidyltransferase family protein [Anaeromyxobacteraceae bacterium]|nr:nucleotidyltransferase family protein [Anaeromyxobacteraceae bacterium]
MALLDAIRALSEFDPPRELPAVDLAELADVLEAHGLAPLASYHLESRPVGVGLPLQFREKLLALYQGVVNDNLFKVMALRPLLRDSPVPVAVLGGLAAIDWLYPHLAFRPLGDLRVAVRGADGARFADAARQAGFAATGVESDGALARFSDGRISFSIQEGTFPGAGDCDELLERGTRLPAFGPRVLRPSAEDAFVAAVAEQAETGLYAPLIGFVDMRELLRLEPPLDANRVKGHARAVGLGRALHGSLELLGRFFPDVRTRAQALVPEISPAERVAVNAIVETASDPAKLVHLRGAEAAARALVAPRRRGRAADPGGPVV